MSSRAARTFLRGVDIYGSGDFNCIVTNGDMRQIVPMKDVPMAAKAIFCLRLDGEGVVGSIVVSNVVYKYFASIVNRQGSGGLGDGFRPVARLTLHNQISAYNLE